MAGTNVGGMLARPGLLRPAATLSLGGGDNNQILSSDATVAQVIAFTIARQASLSQTVTVAQVIAKSLALHFTITSSAAVGQNIYTNNVQIVTQDVGVSQVIAFTRAQIHAVSHTVTVAQEITLQQTVIIDTTGVDQVIGFSIERIQRVAHGVTVQSVPYVQSPNQQTLFDNIAILQIVGFPHITTTIFVNVISAATVAQVIKAGGVFRLSIVDTVTVGSRVNLNKFLSVSHDTTVVQTIGRFRAIPRGLTDTLTFDDDFDPTKLVTITLTDDLDLDDQFTYNATLTRDLVDGLMILEAFDAVKLIGNTKPPIATPGTPLTFPTPPGFHGIPTASPTQTSLSGIGSILLPAAEVNDTTSVQGTVQIKKAITGKTYSYTKTSPDNVSKLKYTWRLGTKKALELQKFLIDNATHDIKIINWLGEVWQVKLLSNPFELTTQSLFAPEQELNIIEVEFQGTQNPGLVPH